MASWSRFLRAKPIFVFNYFCFFVCLGVCKSYRLILIKYVQVWSMPPQCSNSNRIPAAIKSRAYMFKMVIKSLPNRYIDIIKTWTFDTLSAYTHPIFLYLHCTRKTSAVNCLLAIQPRRKNIMSPCTKSHDVRHQLQQRQ